MVAGSGEVQVEAPAQVPEVLVDAVKQLPQIKMMSWGQQHRDDSIGYGW
jgi:hypothetical protein